MWGTRCHKLADVTGLCCRIHSREREREREREYWYIWDLWWINVGVNDGRRKLAIIFLLSHERQKTNNYCEGKVPVKHIDQEKEEVGFKLQHVMQNY